MTAYKIPTIKPLINMPRTRVNFDLDLEEQAIIHNPEPMTKDQLWTLLEKKRFEELERERIKMSG